ncbi:ATP/GTP-binding protein [Streptomyces sp. NPDC020875]|uniref:ATP/GTP-binding protein n=1 Tax=Streptomyces sp. NPDC020875 TaxID=3154898 RepID=UPI0033EA75C8
MAGQDRQDLRALFGSNQRIGADEAFTNREGQWQTTAAALAGHLGHVTAPGFDAEDLEVPRRNVLVFHGVGGIGKSTLSRKLEAALADTGRRPAQWGEPAWPDSPAVVPVRIDLARSAGTDFERVVLTIRLALAGLGRPFPAFDLALKRYWEHNHPGEPLEEYLRRGGLASRFGQSAPQQIQSALADVAQALLLPGAVGTVIGEVTGALVGALRERRQSVRALAGCARLADLLQADPDLDALSYYPHLLSWELARLPAAKQVVPVILLDTFEDTGDRTRRDFERLLQRVVWLMPNAFFVITGRSRLPWADPALHGQLDWTGPTAWPDLDLHYGPLTRPAPTPAGGAARARAGGGQVLIGDFSPEDCQDYLTRRLTHDEMPLIPETIRDVITARSHGLPLHLDLAVMRFLEIQRTGRTPEPADFDVDFPALIARTLSDLTPAERHVLRSVALYDAFDHTLAARAAGTDREAPVLRLLERPFIREDPFGLWPYHLHALIRSTIRTADDTTDDRWSPADWTATARRAHAALGEQWTAHTGPGRALLVGCLRQGLLLARDFRLGLGWLADAAWAYVGDSVWEPLAPPARPNPDGSSGDSAVPATAADALVETLSALARRQHEHRERTTARLTTVIHTGLLPADLHDMALYYRAKADRDLGNSAASRHGMQAVADGGGRLAPAARRGLAHLARLAGDFPTALNTARTLGWEGRHHRVEGDVRWVQGDITRAAAAYQAARTEAEQHGKAGERATSQTQRAFTLAFTHPDRARDEIDLAENLLTGLALRATTLTLRTAALLIDAGNPAADVENRAHLLRTETRNTGLLAAEATLELALCFHHAVQAEHDQITAAVSRLRDLTRNGDYTYYTDIAHFMAGLPLTTPSPAQWLDGETATRHRWHTLITDRREYLRTRT